MDLAVQLAAQDPNSKLQMHVLEMLPFRRADRHISRLLAAVPDSMWAEIAQRGYFDSIHQPEAIRRARFQPSSSSKSAAGSIPLRSTISEYRHQGLESLDERPVRLLRFH